MRSRLVAGVARTSSAVPGGRPIPCVPTPPQFVLNKQRLRIEQAEARKRTVSNLEGRRRGARRRGGGDMGVMERLARLLGTAGAPVRTLGGFFDGLLQTFE